MNIRDFRKPQHDVNEIFLNRWSPRAMSGEEIAEVDLFSLLVVISKTTFDSGKPSRTHSCDAGAAWVSFALQGSLAGLVVQGMQGFDYDKAKVTLRVPDDYSVEAMIAVGRKGRKEELPDHLQEREFPSVRKSLSEIAMEGLFRE